jgi:hypothetical protein
MQCTNNLKQIGLAMANYVSSSDLLPPIIVDQVFGVIFPVPHLNESQHARLFPYLEQQTSYNAINWTFGARWSDGDVYYPNIAPGGADSIPQITVTVQQIATFLCPSDPNPGSSAQLIVNGTSKLVAAGNYPANIGLNRRIDNCNGNPNAGDWKMNGPNYIASTWDSTIGQLKGLRDFVFVKSSVSYQAWYGIATPNNGEVVGSDQY